MVSERRLESKVSSNLHTAPEVHDAEDLAHRATADGGIGSLQIGVIQCIEDIPLEFQVGILPDGKTLRQR